MAPVNPPIQPINEPKYGQDSRAIDVREPIRQRGVEDNRILPEGQKIGDRSAEYEGQAAAAGIQASALENKGWGDLFANVVGIGDYLAKGGVALVKKDIEKKVYDVADRERQQYTKELEAKLSGNGGAKNILDANASMDMPVPEEISEGLPEELATLQSAKEGGKITKLDYTGRLLQKAQAMRKDYPEWKKEIDDEFAKVTGQNPANARINQLITTLNTQAAQAGKEQNAMLGFIRANSSVEGVQHVYNAVKNGQMSLEDGFAKVSLYNQAVQRAAVKEMLAKAANTDRAQAEVNANEAFDIIASTKVAGVADSWMARLGLNSPADAAALQGKLDRGEISAKQWQQFSTDFQNDILKTRNGLLKDVSQSGFATRLGGLEKVTPKVEAALEPLKAIGFRIDDKTVGGVASSARATTAMLDDGKRSLIQDSKAGPAWIALNAQRELSGELYMQQQNMRNALEKNGISDKFSEWYDGWSARLESNRASTFGGKEAMTFNDVAEEIRSRRGKEFKDPKDEAAVMGNLVEKVSKIGRSDVPDKIKISLIDAAFSDGNNNFLSRLNVDGVDRNGNYVRGMNYVFQQWTSPEVTKEVVRLSRSEPALLEKYTNWVTNSFGNNLMKREINDLNNISNPNGDIRVGWDTDNKRFKVERNDTPIGVKGGGEGFRNPNKSQTDVDFERVSAMTNRMNSNIGNLKEVAKNAGIDVDSYVMKTIADAGGQELLRNTSGLPYQIIRNMALGSLKNK